VASHAKGFRRLGQSARTVLGGFADAVFGGAADFEATALAEGLEEAIQEDVGLALLVAGDVLARPGEELSQFLLSPFVNGE
jgi:hypothetical protein